MAVISRGKTQYTYQTNAVSIIGKKITLDELKTIPSGHGAYVSIIPTCIKDDKTYHILSDTFWQKNQHSGVVVGDFGCGIKKCDRPYDILYNGLMKKMPTWQSLIAFQIEANKTEIYTIEYMHAQRNDIRYAIILMVDITPFLSILDELLVLTNEIRELKAYEEIERSILSLSTLSYGLLYYRDFITYRNIAQSK